MNKMGKCAAVGVREASWGEEVVEVLKGVLAFWGARERERD